MPRVTAARTPVAVAGAVAWVAAATGLVYALRPIAPVLSLGVLYTLAVLGTAVSFGVVFAVVVAVASMLAFNFLFLPPVHTLTLTDARNWTALAVYLATAVVSSELAARARRRAAEAEQREREAGLLADTAAAVLREEPLDEIRARASTVLAGGEPVARARFEAAVDSLLRLSDERREADAVRRSDEIKTAVLQTVSHDFRTPISTIRAAVDGLRDESLTLSADDRAELLQTIVLEVARLSRLVENVLDVSRLGAGTAVAHRALWDVDDLVAQASAEISASSRLRISAPGRLPPVLVDAVQLQRVLVNLIENALKFSDEPVDLRAWADGGHVTLDVLDRGPGFDASPSSKHGLGLGLAIAHGFARVNDVGLELTPRRGGGTVARLTLAAGSVPVRVGQ